MHRIGELGGNTQNGLTKGDLAIALDLDRNDLAIGEAFFFSGLGSHMDMTLGSNNTLFDGNLAAGSFDGDGTAALHIAAHADGSIHTQSTSVGQRDLDLIFGAGGAKNADAGQGLFGAELRSALRLCRRGSRLLLRSGERDVQTFRLKFPWFYILPSNVLFFHRLFYTIRFDFSRAFLYNFILKINFGYDRIIRDTKK